MEIILYFQPRAKNNQKKPFQSNIVKIIISDSILYALRVTSEKGSVLGGKYCTEE